VLVVGPVSIGLAWIQGRSNQGRRDV